MENFVVNRKKLILSFLISLAFCLVLAGVTFTFNFNSANAESSDVQRFLHNTTIEYYDGLTNPLGIASQGGDYVIIKDNRTLIYYLEKNGEYKSISGFTSLGQVSISVINSKKSLLFSDDGSIYQIELKELDNFNISEKDNYRLTGGNFFAINSKYLVSVFQTKGNIYYIGNYVMPIYTPFDCEGNRPVAINENDEIFYCLGGKILSRNINFTVTNDIAEVEPTSLISNNEYIYYIASSKVYKTEISSKTTTELSFSSVDGYELGVCNKPKSLSFIDNDLFVVDLDGSVQRFEINDSSLDYTGFAISKGKTAYNRISIDANDIERFGDKIAVIDNTKITIINNDSEFDAYSRDCFNNLDLQYFTDLKINSLPIKFALGKDFICVSFSTNTVCTIQLRNNKVNEITNFVGNVKDICYQSGKFYILTTGVDVFSNAIYNIYSIDEDNNVAEKIIDGTAHADAFTVDVFKNIYISTEASIISRPSSDYSKTETLGTLNNATKLCSDLNGNLFILSNGELFLYNETEKSFDNISCSIKNIQSFSLAFDKKEVAIITEGEEYVFLDYSLNNSCISELLVPENYKTTDKNCNISTLNFYEVKENSNVYKVNIAGLNFEFDSLKEIEDEYVYMGEIAKGEYSPNMLILLGKDCAVLVNKKECESLDKEIKDISGVRYISTGVHAYYLPVITRNDDYVLSDNDIKTRLNKGEKIVVEKTFTFLNHEYYYASFTVDSETIYGYIPSQFTVETLNEKYVSFTFTLETLLPTKIFYDSDLTIYAGKSSTEMQVRVYEIVDSVARISIFTSGEWKDFYVPKSELVNNSTTLLTRIIIIFVIFVIICISALTLAFIKKNRR